MRGSITISITRDDEKSGKNERHAKTFYIESRGHDACKAQGLIEELNDKIRVLIDKIDDLKVCSSEYKQ